MPSHLALCLPHATPQGNLTNARIVVAEGLRKCPDDAPLFVLAASVEVEAGDPGGAGRGKGIDQKLYFRFLGSCLIMS